MPPHPDGEMQREQCLGPVWKMLPVSQVGCSAQEPWGWSEKQLSDGALIVLYACGVGEYSPQSSPQQGRGHPQSPKRDGHSLVLRLGPVAKGLHHRCPRGQALQNRNIRAHAQGWDQLPEGKAEGAESSRMIICPIVARTAPFLSPVPAVLTFLARVGICLDCSCKADQLARANGPNAHFCQKRGCGGTCLAVSGDASPTQGERQGESEQ